MLFPKTTEYIRERLRTNTNMAISQFHDGIYPYCVGFESITFTLEARLKNTLYAISR
jgi:hypothetical protein